MSKAKLYGQKTQYIPNAKADMGKRKKVYQRGRGERWERRRKCGRRGRDAF